MGNKLIICSFIFFVLTSSAGGQAISLHFPRFAGKEWFLLLPQGGGGDTVQQGTIPADGRVKLSLPMKYKNYRGMARWMLRQGGGLDIVWAGESFSVECLSDQPTEENIRYTGSRENDFLRANYRLQEELMRQFAAMSIVMQSYPPLSVFHGMARQEQARLQKAYTGFRSQLASTQLYAARFREIVDLTRGVGNILTDNEREKAAEIDNYITGRLDWEALYTSDHWSGIIYTWVQMHSAVLKNDTALLGGTRQILQKLDSPVLYTSFCEQLARAFVQTGNDSLLPRLAPIIKASGKLQRSDGLLAQFGALQRGEMAPDLVFTTHVGNPADHNHQTRVLRPRELATESYRYSLLIFYQSGCGPCESTMQQLAANYTYLKEKGVRLVSISADLSYQVFDNTAKGHPWADKYCDELGLTGPNFKRYGVAGTPTLFVLDGEGRVRLRTARLEEALDWVKKN